jgi:CspA family cold shock protein
MSGQVEREGVVREFDDRRGLGVIVTEDGEELSVHHSAIEDEGLRALHPGDIVSFSIGKNKFGRRCAVQVRRIGWEEPGSDEPREWSF